MASELRIDDKITPKYIILGKKPNVTLTEYPLNRRKGFNVSDSLVLNKDALYTAQNAKQLIILTCLVGELGIVIHLPIYR
jgi:hypothetical protein